MANLARRSQYSSISEADREENGKATTSRSLLSPGSLLASRNIRRSVLGLGQKFPPIFEKDKNGDSESQSDLHFSVGTLNVEDYFSDYLSEDEPEQKKVLLNNLKGALRGDGTVPVNPTRSSRRKSLLASLSKTSALSMAGDDHNANAEASDDEFEFPALWDEIPNSFDPFQTKAITPSVGTTTPKRSHSFKVTSKRHSLDSSGSLHTSSRRRSSTKEPRRLVRNHTTLGTNAHFHSKTSSSRQPAALGSSSHHSSSKSRPRRLSKEFRPSLDSSTTIPKNLLDLSEEFCGVDPSTVSKSKRRSSISQQTKEKQMQSSSSKSHGSSRRRSSHSDLDDSNHNNIMDSFSKSHGSTSLRRSDTAKSRSASKSKHPSRRRSETAIAITSSKLHELEAPSPSASKPRVSRRPSKTIIVDDLLPPHSRRRTNASSSSRRRSTPTASKTLDEKAFRKLAASRTHSFADTDSTADTTSSNSSPGSNLLD
jgi:hypothetical protein